MSDPHDFEDDEPEPLDRWEEAAQECGQDSHGSCSLFGTEWCDFECPFRDQL